MSNQASTSSSAAVAAAVRQYRASRRISRAPVLSSPSASRLSSPVHAVDQFHARVLAGRQVASTISHGISPAPPAMNAAASHHTRSCRLRGETGAAKPIALMQLTVKICRRAAIGPAVDSATEIVVRAQYRY
jgi:hypothetical protein